MTHRTRAARIRPLAPLAALALAGGCTVHKSTPELAGQDIHLTILHTSDMHSRILPYQFAPNTFDRANGLTLTQGPYGGAARMSTLLRRERARAARTIHIDSGDPFQGAPIFNAYGGEAEFRVMTQMGVSAMAVGNHEFDRGASNLATQADHWAGFPLLAANYLFQDFTVSGSNLLGKVVKPYTILNVDGLVVGVIGMGDKNSLTSIVEGGNSLGITATDTDQTIDYYTKLLRPQVDLLIVASHLGLDEDENTAMTAGGQKAAEAEQAKGDIDVVLGGHLHIVLQPPKQIPILDKHGKATPFSTLIVHSGAFAKTFGRLDLVVHVNSNEELVAAARRGESFRRAYVAAYDYKVVPVVSRIKLDGDRCKVPDEDDSGQACTPRENTNEGWCRRARNPDGTRKWCVLGSECGPGDPCSDCAYCHVPEDPEVTQILEPYVLRMNPAMNLTRTFAVAAVPDRIMRTANSGADSQLGNLVASSMRLQSSVQADFALTNSLGIRADFDAGPLTLETMFNVFPFENTIEIMYLSGKEVQEMFDFVAWKSGTRGCKTQAQISGAGFVMDCAMGKADLILTGSARTCRTTSDCEKNDEICGRDLGLCLGAVPKQSSRSICRMNVPGECPAEESCQSTELAVCGKVLNPFASYRVAVNDYIANGGSGFTMLKRNTAKVDTKISLRDALIDYLQRLDDPQFESAFACSGTPGPETCSGALRCNDPRWKDPKYAAYLGALDTVAPDVADRYCPGATTLGDCFGGIACILPHNQTSDGRIQPRLE